MTWLEMQERYNALPKFRNEENPLGLNPPSDGGLYLIGQTGYNPKTATVLYFVKVGRASDIADRMNKYRTNNPLVYNIDYRIGYEGYETLYHEKLMDVCLALRDRTLEWFMVDAETYLAICEQGFSWFKF